MTNSRYTVVFTIKQWKYFLILLVFLFCFLILKQCMLSCFLLRDSNSYNIKFAIVRQLKWEITLVHELRWTVLDFEDNSLFALIIALVCR